MKFSKHKMRMEYIDDSWCFVDGGMKVKFDQALVNTTYCNKHTKVVEGFVASVHGIDQDFAQWLDSPTRLDVGISAVHALGGGPTLRRVRLVAGGEIEGVY